MKLRWQAVLWMIGALLAAGVLFLIARGPRGDHIVLNEPPTPAPVRVHVIGAVTLPGIYSLPTDSRVEDAIEAAGGLLPEADTQALNLAAFLQDCQQIFVPARAPTTAPAIPLTTPGPDSPPSQILPPPPAVSTATSLVNINTATLEELDTLPGVGPVTAEKIIAHRQANGPFATIEAIMDVSGIGPVKFEAMRDLITIGYNP